MNHLKSASARRTRNQFAQHLAPFYEKPFFWHRAYYVRSVESISPDNIVQAYVAAQSTVERNQVKPTKTKALEPTE